MPSLKKTARERLAARAAEKTSRDSTESLLDFVPRVTPVFQAPLHLRRYTEAIESARQRERRIVVSTPPQHGKTETTLHALVWLLLRDPTRRNAYVTYEANRAEEMSLKAQWIADEAHLAYEGNRKIWRTRFGGGLVATGIGGPLTGYGINGLLIVDDPVKNRAEAESSTFRERTHQWFRDVAMTRVHPGASVIVVQTRWHPDDLAGRLIGAGWDCINLPAINDGTDPDRAEGEALWEAHRPKAWLESKVRPEVGEYTWSSLYQGQPRSRGGQVFRDVRFYDNAPRSGVRFSIGADFAYTSKTYSDYSVYVTLAELDGTFFVLDVYRKQVEAPVFGAAIRPEQAKHPGKVTAFVSGTERGIVDFMKSQGVKIEAVTASSDKFTRAQPVAAAWNAGRILLPRSAPWLDTFVEEVTGFTGVNDRHDDQVDALAGAFHPFTGPSRTRQSTGPGWQ